MNEPYRSYWKFMGRERSRKVKNKSSIRFRKSMNSKKLFRVRDYKEENV